MTYEPPESNILYLVDLNKSGISGYKDLEKPPMTPGAEVEIGVSVASSDGEVLIEEFASPAIGLESLPAGTFEFMIYGSVSQSDGVSEIIGRVYKRTYLGTETELFDFTTGEIESSTDSPGLFDVFYSSSDITLEITDRLILKLYGKTDYVTAVTVNLHYHGVVNQSRVFLPVTLSRFTGGDMATALYDPNLDGYANGTGAGGSTDTPAFSGAMLTKSGTQSMAASTHTPITFDGEVLDTDNYHSNSTNTSRFTAPSDGYYLVGGSVAVEALPSGWTIVATIKKNGESVNGYGQSRGMSSTASGYPVVHITVITYLATGDYVELVGYHNYTSSLNCRTSDNGTSFWIARIGV